MQFNRLWNFIGFVYNNDELNRSINQVQYSILFNYKYTTLISSQNALLLLQMQCLNNECYLKREQKLILSQINTSQATNFSRSNFFSLVSIETRQFRWTWTEFHVTLFIHIMPKTYVFPALFPLWRNSSLLSQ